MVHPHRALDVVANPAVERVRDVREAVMPAQILR